MKRFVSLILSIIMILSLISCSSSLEIAESTEEAVSKTEATTETITEEEDLGPISLPEGYSAGFARVTVNPALGTGMAGYSNADTRLSTTVVDDIMYTVTAVSDGTQVFLFISCDVLGVNGSNLEAITNAASKIYNIPPENVIMNATHTHAGPAVYSVGAPGVAGYLKKLYPALSDAMEDAIRDLAPAKLYLGETETEGLNYVRRYLDVQTGEFLGNWPETKGPEKMRHESEADNQLQVIRFDREEKKDIVLCNWQCHVTTMGGENKTIVSADWVGALRDAVEKENDVLFSYHQGAAGNVVPGSKIKGEKSNSNHKAHGQAIAQAVKAALESATEANWGKFQAKRIKHAATYNDAYKAKSGVQRDTANLLLSALSIGDVAFATAPCEYVDTLGMRVKEGSSFQMTFMCAYTNGSYSYVPTIEQCANGGYEPNSYMFVQGTGENMQVELNRMLAEQYANR